MDVFDMYPERYDSWYDEHAELFEIELEVIRHPDPPSIEVGVGTGRFCERLQIDVGIDISSGVLRIARRRCEVVKAHASFLPFRDRVFSTAYLIFTLCFLKDPFAALREIGRVLKQDGKLIVCIVPRDSGLGKLYSSKDSPFYRVATLYTEREVESLLRRAKFSINAKKQRKLLYSRNDFVCFECGKQDDAA